MANDRPRVLQTGLIKVGVGGGWFAETRPMIRKDRIGAFFYISAFGKVHKRLRRLMFGTSSRPCPSLTWPSCLPPAHFGVVNSCLHSWTSSWAPRPRCIPFRCFRKIRCTGPSMHLSKPSGDCLFTCLFAARLWPSRGRELCLIHASILCPQSHS